MARTDLDFNKYKNLLLEERKKALADEDEAGEIFEESELESTGELTTHDDHQADIASDLFEREKDTLLRDNIRLVVDQIDHALEKIENGTYGLCDVCLKEIPVERLDFEPYATVCIEDLEKIEGTAVPREKND